MKMSIEDEHLQTQTKSSEQRLHIWPESTATQCGATQQKQKVGQLLRKSKSLIDGREAQV
jgi:hypothetical protein